MKYLLCAFFWMLVWGGFLFRKSSCWVAQGHFVQCSVLIMFCYSFFENSKNKVINKPLGSLLCWTGLVTAYGWIEIFNLTHHYPIKIFMPFFNLLCLVILYKLITEYLDEQWINKIFIGLKYSIILLLFYCVIQYFNLDEFFKNINGQKSQIVGTIGNSMHLAGLLAVVQPVFFDKKLINWLALILLWEIILITGSATGLVAGLSVILFWLFFKMRKTSLLCLVVSVISLLAVHIKNPRFFFNSDRLRVWKLAWETIENKFISGYQLGSFDISNIGSTNVKWQHIHNEYLQVIFEVGIIGLVLVMWCILDYFKVFYMVRNDLSIKLASIFFGVCLLSGVMFTAHLWITSTIAMLSYAGIYAIKGEKCALG